MPNPFVGYDNIICFLAPQDIVSTATTCPYVDLRNAQKAFFLIQFGAVTSTTVTDDWTITIEAATAEGGAEAEIDFRYRLSGVVGSNTWGAVTTVAAATGVGVAPDANDNMGYLIEVDPDALAANDYRYARVVLTDVDSEATLVCGFAFLEARYKQTTHISATASASS
jgi:hypothetical protein